MLNLIQISFPTPPYACVPSKREVLSCFYWYHFWFLMPGRYCKFKLKCYTCIALTKDMAWVSRTTTVVKNMRVQTATSYITGFTDDHSLASAISLPSTRSVWMMPSLLLPLLTALMQQSWSPRVKCVSVPSSTNSPCVSISTRGQF